MTTTDRNGQRPESRGEASTRDHDALEAARHAIGVGQAAADSDQTSADADQTSSDTDATSATEDQGSADDDQRASDRDQRSADRDHAAGKDRTPADEDAYDTSRDERESGTSERLGNRSRRANTARDRDATAAVRYQIADARDGASLVRDGRASDLTGPSTESAAILLRQLQELAAEAAADRAQAAADRARAALDRANAANEQARLESELRLAHLDELTGAYRREMGHLVLTHEIDRARRSDGRFVLAFVDVDDLKTINDTAGHAAGDRLLKAVVTAIRARMRSFDPIIRYGGDEFVCGLAGTDIEEATKRFDLIAAAIRDEVGSGISVGLAALTDADDAVGLTERADAAMLEVKASRRARS